MVHVISVKPAVVGWSVETDETLNEQMFLSGAKAEGAARTLAGKLAAEGEATEIQIVLRDGTIGGRFVCDPSTGQET